MRAAPVDNDFRNRYQAQKLFRFPIVGPLLERIVALWKLPASLRYFRAMEQMMAGTMLANEQMTRALVAERTRGMGIDPCLDGHSHYEWETLSHRQDKLLAEFEQFKSAYVGACASIGEVRAALARIAAPKLRDTLEIVGQPLLPRAREKAGISEDVQTSSLSAAIRYALFENAFYDTDLVAAKQRVYLPYINKKLARELPFLDLGCGRGEFLQILRSEEFKAVGVDVNPASFRRLRADGFNVVEQDLVAFLKTDSNKYSGVSALQVAEHLDALQIEEMLALLAARLAPGAVLIMETPNPLSPYVLGQFHMDPTHVAPIPPERLRFGVEAAGFENSRTLFQARIPDGEFAGPDPKAYYLDYAIIAYRCAQ